MKKAILAVSFGTTHADTRSLTIDKIEDKIRNTFEGYEVRRAFTAHQIIKVLRERDGLIIDTPEEALNKLREEGYSEVIVQPLHLIPGEEYEYIKLVVHNYRHDGCFERIVLGRPALHFKGIEDSIPDDYDILIQSIKEIIPEDETVIFMGHGSAHPANASYSCLQNVFGDKGYDNVYIANVEGYPTIENIINKIKKRNYSEVTLIPLMLVAGDHAKNDMAGEDEDSWKNLLEKEGYKVRICLRGLGELDSFQNIYVNHIEDAIEGRYLTLGKTKKGMRKGVK